MHSRIRSGRFTYSTHCHPLTHSLRTDTRVGTATSCSPKNPGYSSTVCDTFDARLVTSVCNIHHVAVIAPRHDFAYRMTRFSLAGNGLGSDPPPRTSVNHPPPRKIKRGRKYHPPRSHATYLSKQNISKLPLKTWYRYASKRHAIPSTGPCGTNFDAACRRFV